MFINPEERRARKIRQIARSGAYALGGGIGLWFMNALYPYEKSAEKIASLFGWVATLLVGYGIITLSCVLFKKNLAIPVSLLMMWIVLPTTLFLIFEKFWAAP